MIETQKTHYADDATLALIAKLEAENAALKQEAERSTRRLVELSAPGSIGAFASRDHWKERAEKAEAENAALRADAERYRWLRDNTQEEPLRPKHFNSEVMPDMRLRYKFPDLVSWTCIGTPVTLDAAIDAAR